MYRYPIHMFNSRCVSNLCCFNFDCSKRFLPSLKPSSQKLCYDVVVLLLNKIKFIVQMVRESGQRLLQTHIILRMLSMSVQIAVDVCTQPAVHTHTVMSYRSSRRMKILQRIIVILWCFVMTDNEINLFISLQLGMLKLSSCFLKLEN